MTYTVFTDHKDGTRDVADGLTLQDVLALVSTIDNLLLVEVVIEPEEES